MSRILGIAVHHGDCCACVVKDGEILAAAEEERSRRIEHWTGFPTGAMRYCLGEGGIAPDRVDHVAIEREPRAGLWRRIGYSLWRRTELDLILGVLVNVIDFSDGNSRTRAEHSSRGF